MRERTAPWALRPRGHSGLRARTTRARAPRHVPVAGGELQHAELIDRQIDGNVAALSAALAQRLEKFARTIEHAELVKGSGVQRGRSVVDLESAKRLLERYGALEGVMGNGPALDELKTRDPRKRSCEGRRISEAFGGRRSLARIRLRICEPGFLGSLTLGEALEDPHAQR